jgi:hypothetical protein
MAEISVNNTKRGWEEALTPYNLKKSDKKIPLLNSFAIRASQGMKIPNYKINMYGTGMPVPYT